MNDESTVANIANRYALLGPYNQSIPLIIASVSVGTTIVNRTPVKLVGHLVGALIIGLIAAWSSNRFVSAFLGYTIGYVCTCFKNGIPNAFILTGIVIGFLFLMLFNMATYAMTTGINTVYFLTLLASALAGVGGVYAAESLFGSRGLYDFKGCSCDDCANTNQCLAPNNTGNRGTQVLARRVS